MKQYLDLLQDILDNGSVKEDRTGTGTLSVFGRQYRHNLADGFPLLTTKKLHLKSIINELIWFLSGATNTRWLNDNGVSIWNEWATQEGELGPIYGAQWTAWPTSDGGSINQIDYVVDCLRNNPNSRRILFHGWNVEYLPDERVSPQDNVKAGRMALPPCHLLYQFYVANGKLSAQLFIRSSDSFLGLPYNTASLAALTMMLAQQCDLEPGEIIICTGDSHIYSNHMAQVQEQLGREPRPLPRLNLVRRPGSIYDYCFEDFELVDYQPHAHIAAPVAV
ncbi:MAG: thymidylate synthase [Halioglobus sp.]